MANITHIKTPALSVLLFCAFLIGCARDVTVAPYELDGDAVWVLVPPVASAEAERMLAELSRALPNAVKAPYADWEQTLDAALDTHGVVVIPDTTRLVARAKTRDGSVWILDIPVGVSVYRARPQRHR